MSVRAANFTIRETHGVLQRPGVQVLLSSDSRAWSSLYASVQRELPFEGTFDAVADLGMVLHLDGPVMVYCRTPRGENSRLNQAGAIVMIPGGMDVRVRLATSTIPNWRRERRHKHLGSRRRDGTDLWGA